MKNPVVIGVVGLVVGLLAGLGVGLVVAPDDGAPRPGVSQQANQPIEREAFQVPLVDTGDETVTAPVDEPVPDGDHLPDLDKLIRNTPIPPVPAGDGAITGHVATPGGEPVAGVVVTATVDYPEMGKVARGVHDRALKHIRYLKWKEAAKREAVTGADGNYRLENLGRDAEYHVTAHGEGWRIDKHRYRKRRFVTGDEVNFTATAIVEVTVEVRMPDGGLAHTADLKFLRREEPDNDLPADMGNLHTSARGGTHTVTLTTGKWSVTAKAGAAGEYTSEPVDFELAPGDQPLKLVLNLGGRPGISGTVIVPGVFKRTAFHVYLQSDPPVEPPTEAPKTQNPNHRETIWVRESGETLNFRFLEIEPGRYRVVLMHGNWIEEFRDVTVGGSLVKVELKVPEPAREDYLAIKAWGPDGEVLTGYEAQLASVTERGTRGGERADVWRPDGECWVRKPEPRMPDGTIPDAWQYRVSVQTEELGTIAKEVDHTFSGVLEFRFQQPAHVTLTVPDFNDHEARKHLKWSVVAEGESGEAWAWHQLRLNETTGAESPFKFGPMVPGRYDIVLNVTVSQQVSELYRETVAVASGSNALHASVPPMHSLSVKVADGTRLHAVRLRKVGDWRVRQCDEQSEGQRLIIFNWLGEGEYHLVSEAGTMALRVPAGGVVEFEPAPYDCLVLSDITPGGRVEALGLKNGDKLVSIDGEDNMNVLSEHVKISLEKESTRWTVYRDGLPTDVTFNGRKLKEILTDRDINEDLDLDKGHINE